MRYLLDTCVLSEFTKPRPNPQMLAWLAARDEASLLLSVLTLGELQKGVAKLPVSRRRTSLQEWLDHDLRERFAGRVLDVTEEVALAWGRLQGDAESRGQTLPVVDALLGATALAHGLVVVTRNEADIGRTGARGRSLGAGVGSGRCPNRGGREASAGYATSSTMRGASGHPRFMRDLALTRS